MLADCTLATLPHTQAQQTRSMLFRPHSCLIASACVRAYVSVPVPSCLHLLVGYATFCMIAGVGQPTDAWAAAAGLPPIDSINVWPLVSGVVTTSPREDILVNENLLVSGDWKFVRPVSERPRPSVTQALFEFYCLLVSSWPCVSPPLTCATYSLASLLLFGDNGGHDGGAEHKHD